MSSNVYFHKTGTVNRQDYDGVGQEGILVCRNQGQPNRFRIAMLFSTPEDKWPSWASPLFRFLTDMVRKAVVRFLNRPGIQQLREVDEKFYLASGVQKWAKKNI